MSFRPSRLRPLIVAPPVVIFACVTVLLALRSGTLAWALGFSVATAALLATSVLRVASGKGERFWAGFAAFGWGYLCANALSNLAMNGVTRFQRRYFAKNAPNLIDDLLDHLAPILHPDTVIGYSEFEDNWRQYRLPRPDFNGQSYHAIGHCAACLAFALAGALMARLLIRRSGSSEGDHVRELSG